MPSWPSAAAMCMGARQS
eukprot:SM000061S19271  [mRNA]  locus=s61:462190:462243:- [translate_table: standard]